MRIRPQTLLLAIGLFLSGCNPIYYSPNTQNVLIAPARGDLIAAAAADGNRVELQGAYALSDAMAIQLNAGHYERDDSDNGNGGSGDFVEGGVGYSAPLPPSLAWEIHGLLGFGSFENHLPSTGDGNPGTTGDISADVVRFGVQPAIGYRSRYFEAAISSRFLGLRYSNVEGSLIFDSEDQVELLDNSNSYFLVEPAFTVRAGLERVKLQFQTMRSFNLTDGDFRQDDAIASLGVVVDLVKR